MLSESSTMIASTGIQDASAGWAISMRQRRGADTSGKNARITTIYDGTTGIQANDLIGRKLYRDKGVNAGKLLHDMF